jgi:molybdenum cofactor biosynthesis enzyme MoaA
MNKESANRWKSTSASSPAVKSFEELQGIAAEMNLPSYVSRADSQTLKQYGTTDSKERKNISTKRSENSSVLIYDTISKSVTTTTLRPRLEELRMQIKKEQKSGHLTTWNDTSKLRKNHKINNNDITNNNSKGCNENKESSNHENSTTQEEVEGNIRAITSLLEQLRTDKRLHDHSTTNNKSSFLRDTFQRQHTYLRISLSERCNLRCQYCMPPEGVPLQPQSSLLSTSELYQLIDMFLSMGVTKVRLTGGEPLLRSDLVDIVRYIRSSSSLPPSTAVESVGITTNGITLARHLPALVSAGLTHVNISLDTLVSEEKFFHITRRKGLNKVLDSIYAACDALPAGRVKLNCVVMKGFNDMELRNFIVLSKDLPLDIRFIEWMPFNDNGWCANRFLSYQSMLQRITSDNYTVGAGQEDDLTTTTLLPQSQYIPPIPLERMADSSPNDTTKWFSVPGHLGRVGFITSMSEHFCSTCNRIRLTADGRIKVCLFGNDDVSLRDAIRGGFSSEDIELLVGAAVRKKKFALGGHGNMHNINKEASKNRPMTLIGG